MTAGGNSVCVWDVVGGGRLLKKLTNFQKTVSCVRLSPVAGPDSAAAPRLLAGSLDGHVKVGRGWRSWGEGGMWGQQLCVYGLRAVGMYCNGGVVGWGR